MLRVSTTVNHSLNQQGVRYYGEEHRVRKPSQECAARLPMHDAETQWMSHDRCADGIERTQKLETEAGTARFIPSSRLVNLALRFRRKEQLTGVPSHCSFLLASC